MAASKFASEFKAKVTAAVMAGAITLSAMGAAADEKPEVDCSRYKGLPKALEITKPITGEQLDSLSETWSSCNPDGISLAVFADKNEDLKKVKERFAEIIEGNGLENYTMFMARFEEPGTDVLVHYRGDTRVGKPLSEIDPDVDRIAGTAAFENSTFALNR